MAVRGFTTGTTNVAPFGVNAPLRWRKIDAGVTDA